MAENQNGATHTAHGKADKDKQPPQPAASTVYSPDCCKTETPETKKEPEEKPLPRFLRAEWVIVYVTVVYTGVAWFTLRRIAQQASVMKEHAVELKSLAGAARDNASAAERNADALIMAQRPWVDVIIDLTNGVIVVYEDILSIETHHTRFCYLWEPSTGDLDRWGPDGANEHT